MADGWLSKLNEKVRDRLVDLVILAMLGGLPWVDRFAVQVTETATHGAVQVEVASTQKTIKKVRLRVRVPKGVQVTAHLPTTAQDLTGKLVSKPEADEIQFGAAHGEDLTLNPLEFVELVVSDLPDGTPAPYSLRITGEDFGTSSQEIRLGHVVVWALRGMLAVRLLYALWVWQGARRRKAAFSHIGVHYKRIAGSSRLRAGERRILVQRILPRLKVFSEAIEPGHARGLALLAADRVIDRAQDPAEEIEEIIDRCTREVIADALLASTRGA